MVLLLWGLLLVFFLAGVPAVGQTPVATWHYDNARDSASTTETLLTSANVNSRTFGKLFTQPVDGYVVGNPLYLAGVNIAGQGTHNVVYVATMHDSVYAFDSASAGAPPLWSTSIFANSPAGATSVPASVKGGAGTTGWVEVGIVSTPVIDTTTGTLYLVAETYESGNVVHRLHALDVTNGQEKFNGPTTIAATYTLNGVTSTFKDLYQMNRPGLLLANGHIYIGFGSNCCNAYSQGWVMSYNAATLQQEGAVDLEPGKTLASIWQKGAGLSADSEGNIYAETGEGYYSAGTNLSESVVKLSQVGTTLTLADWFTPYDYSYLSANDLDMAEGILILPDQPGPVIHEAISIGKQGTIYLLNRDNMGHLCTTCTTGDTQIVQEIPKGAGPESGTPVLWNNTVYFTGAGSPVFAYTLSNGLLSLTPSVQSAKMTGGGHSVITANGNTNGILWFNSGPFLYALDAGTLSTLYISSQAAGNRDKLPLLAHFANPIGADGRVFIGTTNSLVVYGLFPELTVTGGSEQSGTVASALPVSLGVQAMDPYTQNAVPGLTVTFSDGGKGGVFNPATAVTDQTGSASSVYTLPKKSGTYSLTASVPGYTSGLFSETAVPGPPASLIRRGGGGQKGPVATQLPAPLVTMVEDKYANGIAGIAVSYTDSGAGGTFSANPVTTGSNGWASVYYTASTKSGTLHGVYAAATGLAKMNFAETITSGPAANIVSTSGNGQTAAPSTQLAKPLVVTVTDQYGNAESGASVTFNDGGAGGSFSTNPVATGTTGVASVNYTTPGHAGTVTVQASVSGVSNPASFTVTVQ